MAHFIKHGLSRHPLYKILKEIKRRCYSEKSINYQNYGAKGVRVCDEWLNNFKSFYDWAIKNNWERGKEIDKDIKGGDKKLYSPETCSIVTRSQNARKRTDNHYITYNGETKSLVEWCEIYDLPYGRTRTRLIYGVNKTLEFCINNRDHVKGKCRTVKVNKCRKTLPLIYNGVEYSLKELGVIGNINPRTISGRMRKGMSVKDAVEKPLHSF